MEINKFKDQLLAGAITDEFLVFECLENFFLADQYIEALAIKRGLPVVYIKSIQELQLGSSLALVFDYANQLSVLKVDTFNEIVEDYGELRNVIVVCKKIDKHIAGFVSAYKVQIPKLVPWQIEAYIKQVCPALDDLAVEWLCRACGANIYKVQSELDKLRLFPAEQQRDILIQLKDSPESDLFSMPHYELCDALIRCDLNIVREYLQHKKACGFEVFKLIGNLVASLKDIILLTGNIGANKDKKALGIYPARVWEVTRGPKAATYAEMNPEFNKKTRDRFQFLSGLDMRIKSGELDLPADELIDYIICNMLA